MALPATDLHQASEPVDLPDAADVVIVGAGIMGCAAAYFLARRGVRAVVLDKGRIGAQQSTRAWGFVRVQARDPAEVPMMLESLRLWRRLEAELNADLEWREGGCLFLARDAEELSAQEAWLEVGQTYGTGTQLVGPAEVARLLPAASLSTPGGLYTPTDGQAEPRKVTPAFAAAAAAQGARFYEGCAAVSIYCEAGRVAGVETERGLIRAGVVIVTAGASSRGVLDTIRLDLPQQVVRGTVARTNRIAPLTASSVVAGGIGFRQRVDGSLNIADDLQVDVDLTLGHLRALRLFLPGLLRHRKYFSVHIGLPLIESLKRSIGLGGTELPGGPRDPYHPPARWRTERALQALRRMFPAAAPATAIETWGAAIDCTPDGIPAVGPINSRPGLLLATGFTAHGFALGPVVGRVLADLATGKDPGLDLRPLRFERFAEGDVKMPLSLG
jgi:glycine/D-amino acid oxidase-like deaminating enzyme